MEDTIAKEAGFALDADLLKPEAVAYRLQTSRTHVFQLMHSGELESVLVSARRRRVPREALDRYIAGLRSGA